MKIHLLSADAQGRIEGPLHDRLLSKIPNQTSLESADVVLVPISYYGDYQFNPDLNRLRGKKWAVIDTMEDYGQLSGAYHIFGRDLFAYGGNQEWLKFDQFVIENPPILQFVRELWAGDRQAKLQPLEWPCYLPAWQPENKGAFNGRPFEVCYIYGVSHPIRPWIHGQMLTHGSERGYETITDLGYAECKMSEPHRKWIAVHTFHTMRRDINELMPWYARSKIGIGPRGGGVKCFRSTELLHTVPMMHGAHLAWAFPWEAGKNCLWLEDGQNEYEAIYAATQRDDLWDIYRLAQENLNNYRPEHYIHQHILKNLRNVL